MKKFSLTLLGLTAVMSFTGCSATSGSSKGASKYMTAPTDLIVNAKSFSVKVGQKYKLETQIRPLAAYDAKLTYVSSDPSIATVNSKGQVKGVKPGHCVISVYATDYFESEEDTPLLIEKVDAYVHNDGLKMAEASRISVINEMEQYREEHCSTPDSVLLYDYRVYDLVCDGISQERSEEYQTYVVSQSEGLMDYNSQEVYINVREGAKSYEEYGYTCLTSSSYASYMFHRNNSVKNVFYIATEFNAGEVSRYETMCQILDSFFTVANDYFTGSLEDVIDPIIGFEDISEHSSQLFAGYYRTSDELSFTVNYSYTGKDTTSVEDEVRYATQLPAGIKTTENVTMSFTFVNGYILDFFQESKSTFKWKGHSYSYNVSLARRIDILSQEEVQQFIPNIDEYHNVDYYYDI